PVDFCEDLVEGRRGPVERMRDLVPFDNELVDLRRQVIQVCEVGSTKSLSSQDREPLLDLIHPGAARQWLESHPRFKMHHTPVH
ncbi:MAG: hypothetical protein KJ587_09325, partial [Alphaproteobacteria bacterium]|nr:hypothetical protein [Alphaproteobacteria bacterium]